jgi:hypothetical protein
MGGCSGVHGWPLGSGRRWLAEVTPARWTPPPRGKGGTHPGRISLVWNVETALGPEPSRFGQLTVRKAQHPSGNRMAQEAKAGSRKATGNRGMTTSAPPVAPDNRPDTGNCPGPKGR